MKTIVAITALGLALTGCASKEERQINDAKSRLRFISSDPGSVQFNDMKVGMVNGEPTVCGYVNMKLKGEADMTGAVPFIVGQKANDYWVETGGGDCEFDVLFRPCHEGGPVKPWRDRCDAQIAEVARMEAETRADVDEMLKAKGLTSTGDISRDLDLISRNLY